MDLENSTIIKCTDSKDKSYYTVIIKYRVYRNDHGKLFGRLLVLKHKVENYLKDLFDDDAIFQNPILKRTKDGLLDVFKGLTSLCSAISPSEETLTIPELPLEDSSSDISHEMKFVKGTSRSNMWLCYTKNGELISLLKRLSDKYDNNELEPFIFYPRVGQHVYFKQGANIFRGLVLEYVIPENCEDEDRVDIKVLNLDNSDIVVLPQDCFFQLDKEGTSLPMQCVLCALEDGDTKSSTNLSFPMLKKHKLNVVFNRKKLAVSECPIDAQSVTINISTNQSKDKKNEFNVNSKEFVPRNNVPNNTHASAENVADCDAKSDQSTRSSSPNDSSPEDKKPIDSALSNLSIKDDENVGDSSVDAEKTTSVPEVAKNSSSDSKEKNEQKATVISNPIVRSGSESAPVSNNSNSNIYKPSYEKERNVYRYNASKDRMNKFMPAFPDKLKNPTRISSPGSDARMKSGTPSNPSQPSQTQSPALPPNAQLSPYLFQSMPQYPSGPLHFPSQYVAVPSPQQLNSAVPFPFPQYPYATAPAYLPTAAAQSTTHSQYHMPPVSSPYQSYMQPVAMAPFFSSQPPFSQQFYQPSHLQQTWSHLQPSYHVTGSPQAAASHGNNVAGVNNVALAKADSNAASIPKFK